MSQQAVQVLLALLAPSGLSVIVASMLWGPNGYFDRKRKALEGSTITYEEVNQADAINTVEDLGLVDRYRILMEDIEKRLTLRIEKLEAKDAAWRKRDFVWASYVETLRSHIFGNVPPPPPDYPVGLDTKKSYYNLDLNDYEGE